MSADPEDDAGGSEEAVRVFVRIRPLNKRELAAKQTIGWNFNDTSMLQDTQNGQRVYAFDRCFHPDGNNKEVYDRVGKPVVLKALEGFNGTVFTYGQTGSGKTFTMRGNSDDPGMMILCIRDIFDYIASNSKRTFELRVSYMEVYNEEINDLLGSGPNSKNLRIVSEDAVKGAVIGGLTEELVGNPEELMEVLARGESSRSYGSTEMNAESSRSHTIYRLAFTSKEVDDPTEGGDIDAGGAMYVPSSSGGAAGRLSFMNLVDLAGSERQKSTGASGKTLKEGSNINKSLLSLGAVISKLGEASKKPAKGAKPVFIPYRDSKLTRILKQSLGGNTLTSILCTVTPAPMHIEETVSTLKFGQLCKTIKNNVKNNEVIDDRALLKMYKNMVAELRAQLVEAETTRGRTSSVVSGGGPGDGEGEEGDEADGKATREMRIELSKSKKEIEDLKGTVHNLKQRVKEVQELEALKNSLDEYQKESQAAIEEERYKMEQEKEALQKQRSLMLAEKTQLNEKEGRLGTLLGMLDERESKLRQHLSALQEQQSHWQQSVDALQLREEQVEEWNRAHAERQKTIDEASAEISRQREVMESREVAVTEMETQVENKKKELADREATLAAHKSRLAEIEIACTALQDKLSAEQAAVNGRVAYLDSKEKEYSEKLKEHETLDSILKQRENEIESDRNTLDEKLEKARATEEQHRIRETELDKKANIIRLKESEAVLTAERHARALADLEVREAQCLKDANRQTENERMLNEQEARLFELQDQLAVKEVTLAAVEEREKELQLRIDAHAKVEEEFYNVKVAMISSRHAAELSELEGLVAEQLKISSNFQEEIEQMRADLKDALQEKSAMESLSSARGLLIEKLQLEMAALNSDRRQISAAEYQNSHSDLPNFPLAGSSAVQTNASGPNSNNVDTMDNESDDARSRAGGSGPEPHSSQAFLTQLGATQRMLCKILDSHKLERTKKDRAVSGSKSFGRSKSRTNNGTSLEIDTRFKVEDYSGTRTQHSEKKNKVPSEEVGVKERTRSLGSDASVQSGGDEGPGGPRFLLEASPSKNVDCGARSENDIKPDLSDRSAPRPAPPSPSTNSKKLSSPSKGKNEPTFQFRSSNDKTDMESSPPPVGVLATDLGTVSHLSQPRHLSQQRKSAPSPRADTTYHPAEQNSSPLTTAHFQTSPDSQLRYRPYPHFSNHEQMSPVVEGPSGSDYHGRSGYTGQGQHASRYQSGGAGSRHDRSSVIGGARDSGKKHTSVIQIPPSAVRTSKSHSTYGKKASQSPSGVPVASVTLSLQRHHNK